MNAEYIEHAIKHCRAYGLNNIADQADVELARLRAVEAAAQSIKEQVRLMMDDNRIEDIEVLKGDWWRIYGDDLVELVRALNGEQP